MGDLEKYINDFFEKNANPELIYHNLNHTLTVVSRAREISTHYVLNELDSSIVECAAWFHDTGYLIKNDPRGHETLGADLADVFLTNGLIDREIIEAVRGCILSTTLPQKPNTLLQNIICDADLYHLGTHDLFVQDALMHEEVELRIKCKIDDKKWLQGTIRLLNSHHYHTEYCKKLLDQQKAANLNQLNMILEKSLS